MLLLILQNVLICLVSAIPGYFFSKYLIKQGFTRKDRAISNLLYILIYILLGALVTLVSPETQWWKFVVVTLLTSMLGMHRLELGHTLVKGRWWWKQENDTKEH